MARQQGLLHTLCRETDRSWPRTEQPRQIGTIDRQAAMRKIGNSKFRYGSRWVVVDAITALLQ